MAVTLVELLVILAIIVVLIALVSPAMRGTGHARDNARQIQCMYNLKQIALALKKYEEIHHALPPAYTTDANGKPLHSWRTLILPFIEQGKLYESIDLTKPWDDPANAEAAKKLVEVYHCPSSECDDNHTTYFAVLTPNSCLRATETRNLSDVTDAASKTLMVIEVNDEHAVPWMSPIDADEDVVLNLGKSQPTAPHRKGMNAAFVDGHVDFLNADLSTDQRRALISIGGNEKVDE